MPKNGTACCTLGASIMSGGPLAERGVEAGQILGLPARRRKRRTECERCRTRAVRFKVLEAFFRFNDCRNVSSRHPPQREDGFVERLEPLFPVAQRSYMRAAIDELLQRLKRFPHRQVDRHAVIVGIRPDGGGVAVFGLESPHESGSSIRERVDRIQLRAEPFNERVVDRRPQATDVDLREMKTGRRPRIGGDHRALQVLLDEARAQVDVELHQLRLADAGETVYLTGFDYKDIAGARFELLPVDDPPAAPFLHELHFIVGMAMRTGAGARESSKQENRYVHVAVLGADEVVRAAAIRQVLLTNSIHAILLYLSAVPLAC